MTWIKPPLVSEKENAHTQFDGQADDAADEDCVPCSLISLALAAKPGVCPATLTEAEKLRDAAGYGPLGATDVTRYGPAFKARYGLGLKILPDVTDAELAAALQPGWGASIITKPSNFPAGHRLRRFTATFLGFHQMFVGNYGDGRLWLIDPEGSGTYQGEEITTGELATLFEGSAALLPLATEGVVLCILAITDFTAPNPRGFHAPAGTVIKGYDPQRPGAPTFEGMVPAGGLTGTADATGVVSWPGDATPPVPHGGPFVHVKSNSLWPGLNQQWVREGLIVDAAAPVVTQADVAKANVDGFEEAKGKAELAVGNIAR